MAVDGEVESDWGPNVVDPKKGVASIGACPFVLNYNVPVLIESETTAKALAKSVRARNGGLAMVESLALHHASNSTSDGNGSDGNGSGTSGNSQQDSSQQDSRTMLMQMEVACNLLDTNVSPPSAVQKRLEDVAAELNERVEVLQGYVIGYTKTEVIDMTEKQLHHEPPL